MYINNELFDECFCPAPGIGRVCLRGDKELPEELIEFGKEKDGDDFDVSCFSVNVIVEDGKAVGATVNYMAEHAFFDYSVCDNYKEAWNYYKAHADKDDYKETIEG